MYIYFNYINDDTLRIAEMSELLRLLLGHSGLKRIMLCLCGVGNCDHPSALGGSFLQATRVILISEDDKYIRIPVGKLQW